MSLHLTKNSLSEPTRMRLVPYLNSRLAEALDLEGHAKQAHWNVRGIHFRPLHELFDAISADAVGYADLIAERVVQLGGTAHGTARIVAESSDLKAYPQDIYSGRKHLEAILVSLAHFANNVRDGIAHATELKDAATADILTEVVRGLDKWVWMVEAHLAD